MTVHLPNINEPDLSRGESAFQETVVKLIKGMLDSASSQSFVLESFGLDVAVWQLVDLSWKVKFLELKVFKGARPGGVGFGNSSGAGPQVDLLLSPDERLKRLENMIKWIIGDGTRPHGQPRYAFLTSLDAKNSAMGGVKRGKQNNFRVRNFYNSYIDWPELCLQISNFLKHEV